jgi:outer membrane receptor for ferrienterochelin and colicins
MANSQPRSQKRVAAHFFVLSLAFPAAALPLHAEEPPAETKNPPASAPAEKKPTQKIDTIEVKSSQSTYDARQDDTATKIVVTAEEIKKYGDTQVLDVMKRLPGVTVQGNSIRLRGLGSGYTQILIDGERPPPGFSIENLSPDLIERIEIIRAATAEFSTQAVAGTVNIIMKKKYSVSQRELNAGWYSGTGYRSTPLSFQIADSAGKLAFSIGGYGGQAKNDFVYKGVTTGFDAAGTRILERVSESRTEGSSKYVGLYSTLAWTLGGGNSFTMRPSLNLYRYNNTSNGSTGYLLGETTPYPVFRSRTEGGGDSFSNSANLILKLKEGAKLDLKLNANIGNRHNDSFARSFDTSNQQTLERTSLSPSRENNVSFGGKYSTPIVEGHSLVAGWDVGLNRSRSSIKLKETNIAAAPIDTTEDYEAKVEKFAFFAQDEWNVLTNWSVYFGFRWEGINTTASGNSIETVTNKSSVASPLFQTLWKFPDKSGRQLRLALTRTYKAPDTQSFIPRVYRSTVNTSTAPDSQQGNANLKPELATGVDIAYEHFWAKGASLSLSAALRTITDYNTRDTLFVDGRWVNKPINRGRAVSRSIEFDAKLPLQNMQETLPPIDFRFNMARNFSSVDEVPGPNNRLDQQTPFNATLGLDYRMRGGVVVAGGSFTFRSGGDVRTSVTQSRYVTPKRDLDMYVLYKYTPKLQFRLRLANILKPDAINTTTYADDTGRTISRSANPTNMNIGASVEYKF